MRRWTGLVLVALVLTACGSSESRNQPTVQVDRSLNRIDPTSVPGVSVTIVTGEDFESEFNDGLEIGEFALDFAACDSKFGVSSTSDSGFRYEVVGPDGDVCVLRYVQIIGKEQEYQNPDTECRVPRTTETLVFKLEKTGLDLSTIEAFCGPLN